MTFQNQKKKQTKIKKMFLKVLATTVLITALTSCVTTKKTGNNLPYILFPVFPLDITDDTTIAYTDETEKVIVIKNPGKDDVFITSWFYFALIEYDIDVQLAFEKYEYLRKNY